MNNFENLELLNGYGYEIDPQTAEQLGAFSETAISIIDAKETQEADITEG